MQKLWIFIINLDFVYINVVQITGKTEEERLRKRERERVRAEVSIFNMK